MKHRTLTQSLFLLVASISGSSLFASPLPAPEPSELPVAGFTQLGESPAIRSIAVSPDGKLLATGGLSVINIWDLTAHTVKGTLRLKYDPTPYLPIVCAFSPDGATLATASERSVQLWDVATATQKVSCPANLSFDNNSITFSSDGTMVGIAGGSYGIGYVNLWNAKTGILIRELSAGHVESHSIAFSPDGKLLAAEGWEDSNENPFNIPVVKLWNPQTGAVLPSLKLSVYARWSTIAFSPDSTLLAIAGGDTVKNNKTGWLEDKNVVRIYDVQARTLIRTISGPKTPYNERSPINFSPDGQSLADTEDGKIKVWNVRSGVMKQLVFLEGVKATTLVWMPKGKTLAVGCADGTIRLCPLK